MRYRLSVIGVCLVYLLTALEIPLPIFVHKPSSQPFPCQDHPCGCQTAEQCWSHCCCYTPEERWAWARAHDVEPPAYAEKPAPPHSPPKLVENEGGGGWNTVKLRDRDKGTPSKNCCAAHQPATLAAESPAGTANVPLTSMAAWRCQGYAKLWVSTGAVLPVSPLAAWLPDCTPPTHICLRAERAEKVPSTPLDPPPRLSLV